MAGNREMSIYWVDCMYGMYTLFENRIPSLTWNLKTDDLQNESPIPGCHFQVPY